MNRSTLFPLLALGLMLAAPTLAATGSATAPNVIVILADDLGWADVGFHGSPIATPSIDRIANEGIQLDRFYTAPMCTPTRAMLLTGRDPIRYGIAYEQVNPWDNAGVPRGVHFMPESFKAAGYQTAMVGKWHLGHTAETYHPNARGFDEYYGHLNTAIDYWTHSRRKAIDWQRNGESVHEEGYVTDLQGAEAARLIRDRDASKPLFLYVAFNAPHNPMQAPEELIAKYAGLDDEKTDPGYLAAIRPLPEGARARFANYRQIYAAMVASMDDAVGKILGALDDEGIADNTIVLFTSDNGGYNIFGADNMPLRGQKAQSFEGGVRVAAAMRFPGQLTAGGTSKQMITAMDVFPTLVEATGIEAKNPEPFDGSNLWSELTAGSATPRTQDLFLVSEVPIPGQIFYAAYSGPWKLVEIDRPGRLPTIHLLFRFEDDPGEENDLAAQNPEVVKDLAAKLANWRGTEPRNGLRRHPGPHVGWLPPQDWASAMKRSSELQTETISDFAADFKAAQTPGANVLLYLTDEERSAMAARRAGKQ